MNTKQRKEITDAKAEVEACLIALAEVTAEKDAFFSSPNNLSYVAKRMAETEIYEAVNDAGNMLSMAKTRLAYVLPYRR